MKLSFHYITEQYAAVQRSRAVLFDYCKTIAEPDMTRDDGSFGNGGSIRNLLVHIANVYENWVAKTALGQRISFTDHQSKTTLPEIISLFDSVDVFMYEFIDLFQETDPSEIHYEVAGTRKSVSALTLFTHVITHEFHHKGQILSLSRQLGYTPIDTDIIR